MALVIALSEAPIEGNLIEQYRWYLGQDHIQRKMIVEVIQEKLRGALSNNDRRAVEQIFQRDQDIYARMSARAGAASYAGSKVVI